MSCFIVKSIINCKMVSKSLFVVDSEELVSCQPNVLYVSFKVYF